jgi:hypothetical protein
LTPDILLEYIYDGDPKLDDDGIKGNVKDIHDDFPTILLKSNAFGSKYLFFEDLTNSDMNSGRLTRLSNLVLPLNNTETQFVVAKSQYQNFYSKINVSNIYSSKNGKGYIYEDTEYDKSIRNAGESCDIRCDRCIIHFTSRNYFGSYDSLIFQAYAYMSNKSKIYLASFLFKKTSNLELKAEHLLYNEKLYTAQIEFDIPSVFAVVSKDEEILNVAFNNALKEQGIELLENTPIGINVYGVTSHTKGTDNYERLKTLKINSISIPYIYNRLDEIHVNISESKNGDYYEIDPEIGRGYSSFVDYIESMGENIRSYVVMHELRLKETWINDNNEPISEITHKQQHIIDTDGENEEISKNFETKITYRPVCEKGGAATIIDTIKIINTVDGYSYEVTGSIDIENPHKYGKYNRKLRSLDIQSRPIVNVYNKKVSSGRNGSGSSNSSITGSGPIAGTLSGSFSPLGSDGSGSGTGGNNTISGSFSASISGFGSISGQITGSLSGSSISGQITGSLSGSGSISGSFNSTGSGTISGRITGRINGSGSFSGPILGYFTSDGNGYITGSFSGPGSSIGYGSGAGSGSDSTGVVVLNKGGGFVVENMSQNISSFIECTNIGVSIVELSPEDIN